MPTYQMRHSGRFYKGVTHDLVSPMQGDLIYAPGTTVTADELDENPGDACSHGIHFQRTLAEALRWGPKAVELAVPDGAVIVDCGTKLRAASVQVVGVVGLIGANLAGADLDGANLIGANLYGANLYGAHLIGADLIGANLARASLDGANLAGANLAEANLTRANLAGANLTRANLAEANLAEADLIRAQWDASTVWPDGFVPPVAP